MKTFAVLLAAALLAAPFSGAETQRPPNFVVIFCDNLGYGDNVEDISGTKDYAADHPEIVAELTALAEGIKADLGDRGVPGRGQRPPGKVENPRPLTRER